MRARMHTTLLFALLHCASPAPPPPAAPPAAASAPEATTPAAASTCPPGTSPVAVAPCPAQSLAEALHCGARDCKVGTVWDGTKCTAECAAVAAEH